MSYIKVNYLNLKSLIVTNEVLMEKFSFQCKLDNINKNAIFVKKGKNFDKFLALNRFDELCVIIKREGPHMLNSIGYMQDLV